MNRLGNTLFVAIAALGFAACSGSTKTSSQGQLINCTTDPGTGVILRCDTGGGDGGSNTCTDVDEDGDGEPHDANHDGSHDGMDPDDDDGDGIPNDEDCDHHPGEDEDRDGLPYDVRPGLGDTTAPVVDAFGERGGALPTILSVTMDGDDWRLSELQHGTPFVVTQADCDHQGNRDTGRDRVVVTWQTTTGTASDHLDIRYCKQ